jgi:hypothetical protein
LLALAIDEPGLQLIRTSCVSESSRLHAVFTLIA